MVLETQPPVTRPMVLWFVAGLFALSSTGWGDDPIVLRDVTSESGIKFQHTDGSGGRRYIIETVSAGLALFDYDGDGNIDIYFLNGAPLKGTKSDIAPTNALYRNDGNWHFTDVTEEAGVGDTGFGLGVVAADYDNDGDTDLYLNNFGSNVLYRNNGDRTFTDVTTAAGVGNGHRVGAGACFLDIENDGDLDLYVSNYVVFSYETYVERRVRGVPVYPSPMVYEPDPDTLYRNNGDGTFTDVSETSGVASVRGNGMGTVCGDYDNDGDTDIFVCNDVKANFLHQNDGTGHFEEVGLFTGVAYDYRGVPQGSMGVDFGDFDNDGQFDFFATSYQDEPPVLYRNSGQGFFEDVTASRRAGVGAIRNVTWGMGFVDFDNDAARDIFIACGHLNDNIRLLDDSRRYAARNVLLRNTGRGTFVNVSKESGDGMAAEYVSRGAAFDDLDNDGDVDVVILNSRSAPTVLRNESKNGHHWLQIRLRGTTANREGVGSRVEVVTDDLTLVDEAHAGRGYQSHYGLRLYFGLGERRRVDYVKVRWGTRNEMFQNISVDQLVTLIEGTGEPAD